MNTQLGTQIEADTYQAGPPTQQVDRRPLTRRERRELLRIYAKKILTKSKK